LSTDEASRHTHTRAHARTTRTHHTHAPHTHAYTTHTHTHHTRTTHTHAHTRTTHTHTQTHTHTHERKDLKTDTIHRLTPGCTAAGRRPHWPVRHRRRRRQTRLLVGRCCKDSLSACQCVQASDRTINQLVRSARLIQTERKPRRLTSTPRDTAPRACRTCKRSGWLIAGLAIRAAGGAAGRAKAERHGAVGHRRGQGVARRQQL
jgi:hypothetical protein